MQGWWWIESELGGGEEQRAHLECSVIIQENSLLGGLPLGSATALHTLLSTPGAAE